MPNTSSQCRSTTPEPSARPATPSIGALPSGDALISVLIEAACSLCESAPLLQECRILAYRDSLPPGLIGAYVPVLGADNAIHVGILSDVCSCDALAWLIEGSGSALRGRHANDALRADSVLGAGLGAPHEPKRTARGG